MNAADLSGEALGHRPLVGMIVPPAGDVVPPEAVSMYGDAVDFTAVGLALDRLTPEGYDSVLPRIEQAALTLKARGATAVALMGTSLSFYRGSAFNESLKSAIRAVTGLPVTSMSTAVVQALQSVGARRVAVATAYGDTVNQRLVAFLGEHDIQVGAVAALHIEDVSQVFSVADADLMGIAAEAIERSGKADALLISCGGLRTLSVAETLEQRFGLPVVTSSTAGPWAAVRLVGHSGHAPGCGSVFRQPKAVSPQI